jgi:hypothetical protein
VKQDKKKTKKNLKYGKCTDLPQAFTALLEESTFSG